eukprot:COSAG05_NODE_2128_length_3517_cov_7.942657_1_plen_247_part_00
MTSQRRKSPGRGATAHIQGQNRWKLQQLAAQQRQEQERLKRRQQPVRGEEQKRKVGGHGSDWSLRKHQHQQSHDTRVEPPVSGGDTDDGEDERERDLHEAKLERIRQLEEKRSASRAVNTNDAYYDQLFRGESSGSLDSDDDDGCLVGGLEPDSGLHESVTDLGRRLEAIQQQIDADGDETGNGAEGNYDASCDPYSWVMLLLAMVSRSHLCAAQSRRYGRRLTPALLLTIRLADSARAGGGAGAD